MKMKWISLILMISLIVPPVSFAGRVSSGGSSFSSGSSSRSWGSSSTSRPSSGSSWGSKPSAPAPKPSSGWGSSSKPSTPSSGWGGKTTTSPKPSGSTTVQKSALDTQAARQVKMDTSGPKTRQEAVAQFKQQNAQKYTSTFQTEPKVRPSYIPPTYTSGGKTYNVTYNVQRGGYGYFDALGTFILYDALTDAAFLDRHVVYHDPPRVVENHSSFGVFWVLLFGLVAVGVFVIILNRRL